VSRGEAQIPTRLAGSRCPAELWRTRSLLVERVVFAGSWRRFFAEIGLESFDDFYDYPGGLRIGQNNKRSVCKLTFGEGAESKVFYIKRFHNAHLKDVFAAWCNFGRLTSQAGVEWSNAGLLLQNGIDTYNPVCMGERTVWNFRRRSFVVTEQLKSTCLLDFVVKKWRTLERPVQDRIVVAMANLTRRAHELNISLPDLCIWHIFIDENSLKNGCDLAVIDLHRMLRNVRSRNKKLRDLAMLYWSLADDYFDERHKDLLITTYVGDGWPGSRNTIADRVVKRTRIIEKRRNLRHHYARAAI